MNINCKNGLIFKTKIILWISNLKNDSLQNTSIFIQSISSHKNITIHAVLNNDCLTKLYELSLLSHILIYLSYQSTQENIKLPFV